jgi:hypothetical protein
VLSSPSSTSNAKQSSRSRIHDNRGCALYTGAELGGVRQGFIFGCKILEGVIFAFINTDLIFLNSLNTDIMLKLNKYDCILIIRKKFSRRVFDNWYYIGL